MLWYAAALAVAAAVGVVGGLEARGGHDAALSGRRLELRPTAAFPAAAATLTVAQPDDSGNRALSLAVRGLPSTPDETYYELVLVTKRRVAASVGRFRLVTGSRATVSLNAPYALGKLLGGWAVVREREDSNEPRPVVVLTSSAAAVPVSDR